MKITEEQREKLKHYEMRRSLDVASKNDLKDAVDILVQIILKETADGN